MSLAMHCIISFFFFMMMFLSLNLTHLKSALWVTPGHGPWTHLASVEGIKDTTVIVKWIWKAQGLWYLNTRLWDLIQWYENKTKEASRSSAIISQCLHQSTSWSPFETVLLWLLVPWWWIWKPRREQEDKCIWDQMNAERRQRDEKDERKGPAEMHSRSPPTMSFEYHNEIIPTCFVHF